MNEEMAAAAKITPAAAGTAWAMSGPAPTVIATLTLNEWVAVLTGIYIIAQAGLLVPRWAAMLRDWRRGAE